MDERSKRTRPPMTARPLDRILATKLFPARLRPGFVHRARLVEQLDAGLSRGLVVVCAHAGFGKTGLVADWAETRKVEAAWFSIDARDNDPARFWRHAVAALESRVKLDRASDLRLSV